MVRFQLSVRFSKPCIVNEWLQAYFIFTNSNLAGSQILLFKVIIPHSWFFWQNSTKYVDDIHLYCWHIRAAILQILAYEEGYFKRPVSSVLDVSTVTLAHYITLLLCFIAALWLNCVTYLPQQRFLPPLGVSTTHWLKEWASQVFSSNGITASSAL